MKDFLISQVLFAKKIMIIALILQELWRVFKNFVSKVANRARSRAMISNAFSAELTQKNLNFSISKTKAENEKIAG